MRRKLLFLITLVLVIAFVLSACSASSDNTANNAEVNTADSSGGGNGSGGGDGSGGGSNNDANAGDAEESAEDTVEESSVALQITGMVDTEMAWAEEEVRAMDTIDAVSTNKDGEESTYTGVPIITLLEMAGVSADATKIVFVAEDGYTAEVTLEELNACADCIVSFRNQGGFSTVLPGFAGSVQVKGVIEIQVQ